MRSTSNFPKNKQLSENKLDNWSRNNTYRTTFESFHGKRKPGYIPGYKGYIINKVDIGKNFTAIAKNSHIKIKTLKWNNNINKGLTFFLNRNFNKKDSELEAKNHKYGQTTFSNTCKSLWPNNKEKNSSYNNFFLNPKTIVPSNYRHQEKKLIIHGRSGYGVNNFQGNYNKIYKYNNNLKNSTEYRNKYNKIKNNYFN